MTSINPAPVAFSPMTIEYAEFNSNSESSKINTIEKAAELISKTYKLPVKNIVYKYAPNISTNDGTWHFIDKTTGINYDYDYYFTKSVYKVSKCIII